MVKIAQFNDFHIGDPVGFLKQASHILIAVILATSQQVVAQNSLPEESGHFIRSEPSALNIRLEVKSFDSAEAAVNEAQSLLSQSSSNVRQTNFISSDYFDFLKQVGKDPAANNGRNFLILNDSVSRFTKNSVDFFKKSYHDDRIGFAIAIYTTVVETVVWVHVAPLSTLAMSANIAFTIGSAIYFRLNKDKWTQVTEQIKTPMRKFFGDVDKNSVRKRIFYDFMANLGLLTALNLVRVPILSMNQILDEGLSLGLVKMPILLSVVATASLFTWWEQQGSIDKETHPISRFVFRRLGEARSVLLATFASTAALLNPATFGMAPWITLTVVGVGGVVTYLKSKEISDWIERSPLFRKLESVVRMNSNFVVGRSCQALFN